MPDVEVMREVLNVDLPAKLETMQKELQEEENSITNPQEKTEYRKQAEELINRIYYRGYR